MEIFPSRTKTIQREAAPTRGLIQVGKEFEDEEGKDWGAHGSQFRGGWNKE